MIELLEQLDRRGAGVIHRLECRFGGPVLVEFAMPVTAEGTRTSDSGLDGTRQ
jgi:hypothetical protein